MDYDPETVRPYCPDCEVAMNGPYPDDYGPYWECPQCERVMDAED